MPLPEANRGQVGSSRTRAREEKPGIGGALGPPRFENARAMRDHPIDARPSPMRIRAIPAACARACARAHDPVPWRGLRLLGLILIASTAGCGAPRGTPAGAALLQDVNPGGALVVHQVYSSAFEAIESALESDDLDVARATLGRLRARLLRDRASVPSLAEARTRSDEVAVRTASGELPSRESVEAALKMADGFERVIEGRIRLASIELSIELRRVPDTEFVEVSLVGESSWGAPLVMHVRPLVL